MSITFCLWTGRSEKAQEPEQHRGGWQGNRSTLQEVVALQQHEMLAWLFLVIPACPVWCLLRESVTVAAVWWLICYSSVCGTGQFAPGGSGAALFWYLHVGNKLMCECGHRECFEWVHWTELPQTSNYPAGHPKQAVLHGTFKENISDSTCSNRDLSKTQGACSTQVVWLQIEAFEIV